MAKQKNVSEQEVKTIWNLIQLGIDTNEIRKIVNRSRQVIVNINKSKGDYSEYRRLVREHIEKYKTPTNTKPSIHPLPEKHPEQLDLNVHTEKMDLLHFANAELKALQEINDKLTLILEALDHLSVRF